MKRSFPNDVGDLPGTRAATFTASIVIANKVVAGLSAFNDAVLDFFMQRDE